MRRARTSRSSFVCMDVAAARGFTLVELLVVMVILAALSGFVLTSLREPQSEAETLAKAVARTVESLADLAIVEGRPTGLEFRSGDWRAYELVDGAWQLIPLAPGTLPPSALSVQLIANDPYNWPEEEERGELIFRRRDGSINEGQAEEEPSASPDIVFNPTGDGSTFEATIGEGADAYRVEGDGLGEIEVFRVPE